MTALRGRLRAWWEGEPWEPPAPVSRVRAAASGGPAEGDAAPPHWTPERIEAAQRVWGAEHLTPGGDGYVRELIKPLALDPSMTIAELGCGLGATVRMMHRSFNVWPQGFEACSELLDVAVELSTRVGLAKKAPIAAFDPERPAIRKGQFDRIIARDLLHQLHDKAGFLHAIRDGLKKRGQLLLTDFVLRESGPLPAPVAAWAEGEPVPSEPWTPDALAACLEEMRFNVHILEDETDRLIGMILADWKALQASLHMMHFPPGVMAAMLDEGERWARCVAALDGGGLRHCRVILSR